MTVFHLKYNMQLWAILLESLQISLYVIALFRFKRTGDNGTTNADVSWTILLQGLTEISAWVN